MNKIILLMHKESYKGFFPSERFILLSLIITFIMGFFILDTRIVDARSNALLMGADGSFAELVKKAKPSVVNIYAMKIVKENRMTPRSFGRSPNDPFNDFFERFFKDQMPREHVQKSLGTGFILSKDGLIITNNHVVEKTEEIKVKLADEKEYNATIIGRDPKTDLALIQIKPEKSLTPLPLGDSDKLEVGDLVVAIGNPFGLGNTVTAGIVSAKYRNIGAGSYDNFIQTDASINPGNSGGPLLNIHGEVIGINSAIFSQHGGSIGIGFAIPINMAKDLLPQLKKGKVIRGWLGVLIQTITPELQDKLHLKDRRGALIADISIGGPAEKANLKRGDVIISFNGNIIKEMKDLPYIVAATPVGEKVKVEVIRNGRKETLDIIVGELQSKYDPGSPAEARPYLGLTVEKITPQIARNLGISGTEGLIISQIENNSPAAEAGLRVRDVVLEIDQSSINNLSDFQQKLRSYNNQDSILFLVKRGSSTLYLILKVKK